jgi:V/A-type H+-transporting ATPase subunit I
MSAREPLPEERFEVPSVMHSHRLLKPFVALVKTYGIPRYGEFDPTILFAITFVLMYGMMFGDIGHGAVIAVAGILMRGLLKHFTTFVVAVGCSSVVFGFLYGSIFGYEHVIHPVWMSPLSDPMLMLTLALYWGIGFIVLAIILTIINRIVDGDYKEALLERKGDVS